MGGQKENPKRNDNEGGNLEMRETFWEKVGAGIEGRGERGEGG